MFSSLASGIKFPPSKSSISAFPTFGPATYIHPLSSTEATPHPPFCELRFLLVGKEEPRSRPSVCFLLKMEPTAAIVADVPPPLMLTSGASGRVNALLSLRVLKAVVALLRGFFLLLLVPFRRQQKRSGSRCEKEKTKEEKQEVGVRKGAVAVGPVLRVPAGIVGRRSASIGGIDPGVATRRALAIKKVQEEGDERTVRDFSLFVTLRGEAMFTQSWTPAVGEVRGLVVLLHGLNEHGGRYNNFAKELNASGYKVYAMDWVGHGGSDGLHGYVHSLNDAVNDTKAFIEKVLAENPRLPCFLFGHSTGAAVILKAVLDPKMEAVVKGVVLTSPAIRVQPSHPIFLVLAPVFSFFLPRYQFSAASKPGLSVSRDQEALVAKYSDPLVFTGSIRVRTGYEILRITSYLQQNLQRVRVPLLVLHGTADGVTDPQASQRLYEEASSSDKSIKLYEGLLHDLLFEPEKEEITQDILKWLNFKLKD